MAPAVFFLYFTITFLFEKIEKFPHLYKSDPLPTIPEGDEKEEKNPEGDEKEEKKTEFSNTLICVIPVFDESYLGGCLLDFLLLLLYAVFRLIIISALSPIREENEEEPPRNSGCWGKWRERFRKWFGRGR